MIKGMIGRANLCPQQVVPAGAHRQPDVPRTSVASHSRAFGEFHKTAGLSNMIVVMR
jgi:hypothetical protein